MSEERIYIKPLNEDHRLELGMALGLAAAVNLLRARAEEGLDKLPGFRTALAQLEAMEASHRADVAGKNIRAAAAAGYDVQTHMVGLVGKAKIFVEPMDLEQLAEFAPASVTLTEGGDAKQAPGASLSGAVPNGETPNG